MQPYMVVFIDTKGPALLGRYDDKGVARRAWTTCTFGAALAQSDGTVLQFKGGTAKQAETRKLATGETKILYDEKLSGEKGAPLDVPGAFVVGVPVFDGGDPYALPVRLRLRVASGKIAWTFALLGADDVVRDAVKGAVEKVRVVTGLTVFEGTPEA